MARPTVYKPEYVAQAKKLAGMGLTDTEIAEFFEVSPRTLYYWKATYPAFAKALVLGKKGPNDRVKDALFRKACGYEIKTEKVFQHNGKIILAKTVEHIPPDTTAAIFWLCNRDKDNWKQRNHTEHSADASLAELVLASAKKDAPSS